MFLAHDSCYRSAPLRGQSFRGRPVRETRTPVNMGNQPHRDNGEVEVPDLRLTLYAQSYLVAPRSPSVRVRASPKMRHTQPRFTIFNYV